MGWSPFRKRRELELEALDRWRTARKLASSDLFRDQQTSYTNCKHQAQTELWAPGTRFGGGGGHDGGSTSQTSSAWI